MKQETCKFYKFLKTLLFFFIGCFMWAVIFAFVLLTLPVFMYRFILSKIIAPCFHPEIGKLVGLGSSAFATDFLQCNIKTSSRDAVVLNLILEGTITMQEIKEKLISGWLSAVDNRGRPMYPEFRQYIGYWKGFMFWKKDADFKMENHLVLHELPENGTDEESEDFVCELMEALINRQFDLRRSPWEIHVLNKYKNKTLCDGIMTMFCIRFHHVMADGPSFITVVGEGLFNSRFADMGLALPSQAKLHLMQKLKMLLTLPERLIHMIHDMGFGSSLLFRSNEPWMVPNSMKTYKQIYGRSTLIPVDKIKQIKNKFGTSFTAVLLSSVSAGIAKAFENSSNESKLVDSISVGIPIPLRNRANSLDVKSTGTVFHLPVSSNLTTVERLMKCNHILKSSNKSTIPIIAPILHRIILSQIPPLARFLYFTRTFSTFLTTFPGPEAVFRWHGKNNMVGGDNAVGGLVGNAGVGFIVFSAKGHLRITVTAECALMDREDVNQMINAMETEINNLYSMKCEIQQLVNV